ncbi:hypothetical protein ACLEIY_08945, partial [Acetobacter tropicalis]|uniref:hypothetical protein n=1 Tax=Acetobacter tropicalis TaxID=104102 RepID=UPI0039754D47
QRRIVGGPVRRSVARRRRLAHHTQLTNWFQTGNPGPVFAQQSRPEDERTHLQRTALKADRFIATIAVSTDCSARQINLD